MRKRKKRSEKRRGKDWEDCQVRRRNYSRYDSVF